jgi:uncharacterized membrane protein
MKKTIYLFICILAYLLYGIALVVYKDSVGNLYVCLERFSGVPAFLFCTDTAELPAESSSEKGVVVLLSLLWLVFFPNAPYMVTDLMYFSGFGSFSSNMYSLYFWIKLLYISSGMLMAALLGLGSLYDMHKLVLNWKGRVWAVFFSRRLSSGRLWHLPWPDAAL